MQGDCAGPLPAISDGAGSEKRRNRAHFVPRPTDDISLCEMRMAVQ
jgi:hypothetical protein